jgi:hypothetical protein
MSKIDDRTRLLHIKDGATSAISSLFTFKIDDEITAVITEKAR